MGGDVGVLQEIEGDELVVFRRLRIVEDLAQLGKVTGAQIVVDIGEGLLRQQAHALRIDNQNFFPV